MGKKKRADRKIIDMAEWPEPMKISFTLPNRAKGHGHPFDYKVQPFRKNRSLPRKKELTLAESLGWAIKFREGALAKSTIRAYKKAWKQFKHWAKLKRLRYKPPLDKITIQMYLAYKAKVTLSSSEVTKSFCGIKYRHRKLGIPFETTQMEKYLLEGVASIDHNFCPARGRTCPPQGEDK